MSTLLDLAKKLEKKADELETRASDIARDVALAIVDNLINSTPVDTSKALSNWQASLNTESFADIPAHQLGSHGSTRSASMQEALSIASNTINNKKAGEKIYIYNNAKYIVYLNAGSSMQAPAGFVERAVLIGRVLAEQRGARHGG